MERKRQTSEVGIVSKGKFMTDRELVERLESLWQAYGYGIALEAAAEIKRLREALKACEGEQAQDPR